MISWIWINAIFGTRLPNTKTPTGEDEIRIKVEDDVIVFPQDAVGKKVIAEGTVEEKRYEGEDAVAYLKHLAEERGEDFDPASVTGPVTFYQIRSKGAIIHGI